MKTMKRLISLVATLVVLLSSCAPSHGSYTMRGTVVYSDTIVTVDGNTWGVTTDIAVGSPVVVTFDDNGTADSIFDDIITSVTMD